MKHTKPTRIRSGFLIGLCLVMSLSLLAGIPVHAAAGLADQHRFRVAFDTTIPSMGLGAFENRETAVIVERCGEQYYLTLSIVRSAVKNLKILTSREDRVGETVVVDQGVERHTYCLTRAELESAIPFSIYIKKPMNKTKEFTITLRLDEAEDLGAGSGEDLPARFVPTLTTGAADCEMEKGTAYIIPPASAVLKGQEVPVTTAAYYLRGKETVPVSIENGQILLSDVGEYHLVYTASSEAYRTSRGNPAETVVDVRILSKVGAQQLAMAQNLPENVTMQAGRLDASDAAYEQASGALRKISDHFAVIRVTYLDGDRKEIRPEKPVELQLFADSDFERSELGVYYMDAAGVVTELPFTDNGNFVEVQTAESGCFIVCGKGVGFTMPLYGYILIALGVLLIAAAAVIIPVTVSRRKKQSA